MKPDRIDTYKICKYCDLGLIREDCSEYEYAECVELFMPKRVAEVFLIPRKEPFDEQ